MEIKDADETASQVRIEIEKTGSSELQTDGVTVNHTLFDVGRGSVFLLQLVRVLNNYLVIRCNLANEPKIGLQYRIVILT